MRHNCFVRDWSGDPRLDKFMDKVEFSLIECNLTGGPLTRELGKRRSSRSNGTVSSWQKSVEGAVETPRNFDPVTGAGRKDCVGQAKEFLYQTEKKITELEYESKKSLRFSRDGRANEVKSLIAESWQLLYSLKYADLSDWGERKKSLLATVEKLQQKLKDVLAQAN